MPSRLDAAQTRTMFDHLLAHWHYLGAETKGALIGAFGTVITGAVGFGGIIFQMRAQSRTGSVAILEAEKRRLKTELYEELVVRAAAVSESWNDFTVAMRVLAAQMRLVAQPEDLRVLPSARIPDITNLFTAAHKAAVEVIFVIERRLIVDPRLIVFRSAISAVLYDVRTEIFGTFFRMAVPILPKDIPGLAEPIYDRPSPEDATALATECDDLANRGSDVVMYIEDLMVEIQNLLLGELFGHEVPYRRPLDPSALVVRLDKHQEIEAYIREETAWGQTIERVDAENRQRFNPAP